MKEKYVLVINPGSTSTKVAIFKDEELLNNTSLNHPSDELKEFEKIADQYDYRKNIILQWLEKENVDLEILDAVVGRGGLLRSIPGGTYTVTDTMVEDLKIGIQGEHASNLGGIIARSIADDQGIPSFIVDPVSVDEFDDIARVSGLPELPRISLLHTLNIKAVARRATADLNKDLEDINLILVHLGGGISVAPLRKGKIVDVNNASEGGPFSPERAGGLPTGDIVKMCFSKEYTYAELKRAVVGRAGLVGYLGTNDAREVEKMIAEGDKKADFIYDAMAYQIAKEIGAMSTVLKGEVEAIVLTGGLAYSKILCERISNRIKFIAPLYIYPGEDEMLSLAEGAMRILNGKEEPKIYEEEVK